MAYRINQEAKHARELFNTIQEELDNRQEDLKDGLSFLDMKNDTLLSYMIDVCNIVLRKTRGQTIEGHQSVERCVEYRVILEKVRAIDQKLAYQLNKLITLPDDVKDEPEQKIDPRNLDIDLEYDEEDEDEDEEDNEGDDNEGDGEDDDNDDGIYKPPKSKAVVYNEEGGNKGKRKNFYLDEDYEETRRPEVEAQTRYEEDNYTRLPKKKLKPVKHGKKGKNKKNKRR